MPSTSGKRALLHLLKQEGINVMFGNPGTTELPLMDALAVEPDFRYVLCLQESIALAMADGYARATGGIAAVNLHAAPGVGNAMGMLFDSHKNGTPLLVTAGQQAHGFSLLEPNLYAELPPMVQSMTKWAHEVNSIEDLPRSIHRAVKVALAPPTGPVFLSLPVDVLNADGNIEYGEPSRVAPRFGADPAAVAEAAKLLAAAKSPLIIAGDAVAQSRAHAELVRIAEMLGAPVHIEGEISTNAFPLRHPLFRGPIVRLGHVIRKLLEQHDLLFSVGADLFTLSLPPEVQPVPPGLRIVHLDTDPWQLGKNYHTAPALLGDPKTALPQLATALDGLLDDGKRSALSARRKAVEADIARERAALTAQATAAKAATPIAPLALMQAVGDVLPENAILIDETISSGNGLQNFLKCDGPDAFHGIKGGGIGWGLPAAVGIKLASPGRPVVALVGDGSSLYSIQALWTAAHEKAAVVFVILNNKSYRVLKQRLSGMRGLAAQVDRYVAMELAEPAIDFVNLARSMGVRSLAATTIPEFTDALRNAINADGPTLIDAHIDSNFKAV